MVGGKPSSREHWEPRQRLLETMGIAPASVPALVGAHHYSAARLAQVRDALTTLASACREHRVTFFVLGSVGRFEASQQSDLDLAVVTEGAPDLPAALNLRAQAIKVLRDEGFDIPEKTFDRLVPLAALTQIGGRHDSNDNLTYRALLLTEGVCVAGPESGQKVFEALLTAYCRGPITSGRYFTALSNDLHRYYRTVCLDYRHKVEVGKQWATRSLKLKHSRRLWHLANLATWCDISTVADSEREAALTRQLGDPPLWRLIRALHALGGGDVGREVVHTFDTFLGQLARPEIRAELESLAYPEREACPTYRHLYANASALEAGAMAVFEFMWTRCRDHMFRFSVL